MMYRENYTPERSPNMVVLVIILAGLIGAMVYVTRDDPDPQQEAEDVHMSVREAYSPYQRIKAAEERMAKKIAAAYAQGRTDAARDGCRAEPRLSGPVR
jgi:hypothetical protein